MCLIALALDHHRRFPLVVAGNRDEFHHRPAARLAWWQPEAGGPPILGGRDLEAGGTWLGLTAQGRLAMTTNVRGRLPHDAAAPSRGHIVPQWLATEETADRFWTRTALTGYNGFNLVAADFRRGECFWASNTAVYPQRLERGIYGLSNDGLDTPWPKVQALKRRLAEALEQVESASQLANALLDALSDRTQAPDEALPDTGVSRELEKQLSAAFIRTADGSYGTRCSTVIVSERLKRHTVTHVFERTFSPHGGLALLRRSQLNHWPPRYENGRAGARPQSAATPGEVSESDTGFAVSDAMPLASPRRRVRSLLKPDSVRIPRG